MDSSEAGKRGAYRHIVHPFGPLYDTQCKVLILGSLPSLKSREQNFFYGHPRNRFWPLLAALFHETPPVSVQEKREMALRHHIALWDTIYSCEIIGSSDSSIRSVEPTDLCPIVEESGVRRIFCNGRTSWDYYRRYQEKELGMEAVLLPSTSPANAAWSMDRLIAAWSVIKET